MLNVLLNIRENSVKATHGFSTDKKIEKIRSYVPQALKNVQHLVVAENASKFENRSLIRKYEERAGTPLYPSTGKLVLDAYGNSWYTDAAGNRLEN